MKHMLKKIKYQLFHCKISQYLLQFQNTHFGFKLFSNKRLTRPVFALKRKIPIRAGLGQLLTTAHGVMAAAVIPAQYPMQPFKTPYREATNLYPAGFMDSKGSNTVLPGEAIMLLCPRRKQTRVLRKPCSMWRRPRVGVESLACHSASLHSISLRIFFIFFLSLRHVTFGDIC